MRRILVTGATGFVGSHLLDWLVEDNSDTIYGMRRPNSDMKNVKHLGDKVKWITGDLCDPVSCRYMIESCEPHHIYHLGAQSWVTPSWVMPSTYMQTNAIGTINLLDACDYYDLDLERILVSCTPEEFGDVTEKDLPLTEKSPLAPCNPYAASKVAQDAVCQTYWATYKLPIIRTRAFNHEGPRRNENGALANFAKQIALIEVGKLEPVVRVGNLHAKRNFTHVKDMVRAYWVALHNGVPGELYLIGSDNVCTIGDCLNRLLEMSTIGDIRVETDQSKVRPTELCNLLGDYSKFREIADWEPEYTLDAILSDILNYWRGVVANG